MKSKEHKGWYSRGYLPHFDSPEVIQMIGFRLADSVPQQLLKRLATEFKSEPSQKRLEFIEEILEKGYGECHLAKPNIAQIVKDILKQKDGIDYKLISWVVMPNHVHMLVEIMQDISLPSLVKWWKGSSAHKANKILQRSGTFWHRDYFDRYIRDEAHYYSSIEYIHMNPVKAGLIDRPQNWRFSSAWEEPTEVGAPHKE